MIRTQTIDLAILGARVVSDQLLAPSVATVQASPHDGANWSTAVLTLKRSNDGREFLSLASAVTLDAEGMTASIDCDFGYLAVEVTTAEGSTKHADISIWHAPRPS